MNKRNILLVITGVIILVAITFVMYKQSVNNVTQPLAEQTPIAQEEQQKTDFGSEIPTDFPTDILIEEGAEVEQSYSLNYAGQNQLTIVFPSTKTIKENYATYEGFLKNQQWDISNTYKTEKLSSLYGTKGSNEINVTITSDTSATSIKSQVSISILKK
ncbi:MAG: hypothetical protein WBC83_02005 [Minisyncoccia bacterium]